MTSTETVATAAALKADRNADLRQDCGAGRATVAMPYKCSTVPRCSRGSKGIHEADQAERPGAWQISNWSRRIGDTVVSAFWPYWLESEITPATKRDIPGDKI